MADETKKRLGQRVQIYLPADLLERWEQTPRYERSKAVARALRLLWQDTPSVDSGNTEAPPRP